MSTLLKNTAVSVPDQKASPKVGQAIRLVDTKSLEKKAWLSIRQKGIGASDAAAAIGLNPFKSQLELWMEKTSRSDASLPDDLDSSPLYWGEVLEPIVAKRYQEKTGRKVKRVNAVLQHP